MIPAVCSSCKRPLPPQEGEAPEGLVSHGLCRPCMELLYPGPEFAEARELAPYPLEAQP